MGTLKRRNTHTGAQAGHQPCVLVSRIPKPYHTPNKPHKDPSSHRKAGGRQFLGQASGVRRLNITGF